MWITGFTRPNSALRDLANVACTSNTTNPETNWALEYPKQVAKSYATLGDTLRVDGAPPTYKVYAGSKTSWDPAVAVKVYVNDSLVNAEPTVTAQGLTNPTGDFKTYVAPHKPLKAGTVTVKTNGVVANPSTYTLDVANSSVTFGTALTAGDAITADYTYITFTVDFVNGKVSFSNALNTLDVVKADYSWINSEYNESLAAITDRVVLRTTTTPVTAGSDPTKTDPDQTVTQLTMWLELSRPAKLVNPETGRADYPAADGSQIQSDPNNHYIRMRIFDKWDSTTKDKASDAKHSEWSKFSWYQDFRETMKDALDSDPGTTNVQDGVILQQVKSVGINGDLPIQFWMSITNDRLVLFAMGDPGLDYSNYLCTFAYVGKIDSLEGSVNDTAGNFALTTGSSTLPALEGLKPANKPERSGIPTVLRTGALEDNTLYLYRITYRTVGGESAVSDSVVVAVYPDGKTAFDLTQPAKTAQVLIPFKALPSEATEVKLYRAKVASLTSGSSYMKTSDMSIGTDTVDTKTANTVLKYNPAEPVLSNASKGTTVFTVTSATSRILKSGYMNGIYQTWWANEPLEAGVDYTVDSAEGTITLLKDVGAKTGTFTGWVFQYRFTLTYNEPQLSPAGDAFARQMTNFKLVKTSSDIAALAIFDDGSPAGSDSPIYDGKPDEGVKRDPISGTVIEARFSSRYGSMTATGVADVAMYKTRGGLYFQKHQAAVTTAEEFMPRGTFSPSRWTGMHHMSQVFLSHSNEGYRGTMKDVVVVDSTAIVHLDELVVNKGSTNPVKPEQKYKYFKVNAPFHFLTTSGNGRYGIAVKMV